MLPAVLFAEPSRPDRAPIRIRPLLCSLTNLADLEARSDTPDVQRYLSAAIRDGKIRVVPYKGSPSRVRVVRLTPDGRPMLPPRYH